MNYNLQFVLILILSLPFSLSFFPQKAKAENKKQVILLIGDGLGSQEFSLLLLHGREKRKVDPAFYYETEKLFQRGKQSTLLVTPTHALVTDSACAATQFATGETCEPETLSSDLEGHPIPTIIEKLKDQKDLKFILLSDTRITHATPAAFYAHQASRNDEKDIFLDLLRSNLNLGISAGRNYIGAFPKEEKNFSIYTSWDASLIRPEKKTLFLIGELAMQTGFQENKNEPEYQQIVAETLDKFSDQSFFMMVEVGQIDWASHNNDAGYLWKELLKYDQVLGSIISWMKHNPEALLISTADHETGGLGISYRLPSDNQSTSKKIYYPGNEVFLKLAEQKKPLLEIMKEFCEGKEKILSVKDLQQLALFLQNQTGILLSPEEFSSIHANCDFKLIIPKLGKILSDKINISWATAGHTATPVPLLTFGKGQEEFQGVYSGMELGKKIFLLFTERRLSQS
jgi:alkaline phosphatase